MTFTESNTVEQMILDIVAWWDVTHAALAPRKTKVPFLIFVV